MSQHLPALPVIAPLLSALLITMLGWFNRRLSFPIALAALTVALLSAIGLMGDVLARGVIAYKMGGWDPPWGIAYRVDHLNGLVLVVVLAAALIGLIATRDRVKAEFEDRIVPFYTLFILFVTGLSGILLTGDAFNLYVLLEIASLTGYALIGMGEDRAPLAGLNYLLMGTIGASFYLLGVGYLYIMTGTLNMVDLAARLPGLYDSHVAALAFFICLTGLFVKMAFFPVHVWLPNAYSNASSAASILIAPLTTKVMIYVMIRITLTVFTPDYAFDVLDIGDAVVWLAVIAIVMGSVFALAQNRLKRILSYIVVAEVGYMVGGFWLGNRAGITGSILHIVNDAAMTLCVFLAAGALMTRVPGDRLIHLQGLFRKMPVSMAALAVGGLSIIGVPPTCGFFSKWYLISGGIDAGHYGFVAALLFSSLVNVALFFRIFEIAYYEPFGAGHGHGHGASQPEDAPAAMLAPLVVVAVLLVVLGLYSGDLVSAIIQHAIPARII
jgi:multicomponent Na+:H+ antiporter subunit D